MKCIFCNLIKEKGNTFIADFDTSVAFLNLNQNFYGRTFIIFKKHVTDLLELSDEEMNDFTNDMKKVAKAIKKSLKPDKLNYAILGNKIEHLHWHVYPRYKNDGRWGKNPWSDEEKILTEKEYKDIVKKIKAMI